MRTRYTYFIQGVKGGPIKIGTSESPKARLRELQSANPTKLQIIHVREGAHWEREFHRKYAAWRRNGEWFDAKAPGLVDEILGEIAVPYMRKAAQAWLARTAE